MIPITTIIGGIIPMLNVTGIVNEYKLNNRPIMNKMTVYIHADVKEIFPLGKILLG